MLKNLIPFLQHVDKLVRTCSQQVRQLSEILAIISGAALFFPYFRGFAGQARPEPSQGAAERGSNARFSQSPISEVGK